MLIAFPLFSWGRESMCHNGGGHQRIATRGQFSFPTWCILGIEEAFHDWQQAPLAAEPYH